MNWLILPHSEQFSINSESSFNLNGFCSFENSFSSRRIFILLMHLYTLLHKESNDMSVVAKLCVRKNRHLLCFVLHILIKQALYNMFHISFFFNKIT